MKATRTEIKAVLTDKIRDILNNHGAEYNAIYAAVEAIENNAISRAKTLIMELTGTCMAGATPEIHKEYRTHILDTLLVFRPQISPPGLGKKKAAHVRHLTHGLSMAMDQARDLKHERSATTEEIEND